MSSGKSIDGLQRRGSSAQNKRTTTSVGRSQNNKKTANAAKKKKIGVSDEKEEIRRLLDEQAELDDELGPRITKNDRKRIKENKREAKKALKDIKPKKKHRVLKRVIIVVVLLLVVVGGGAYLYLNDFVSQITDGGSIIGLLLSDPDTPLEKDENGRLNILVFGTEGWSMDNPNYDGGFLTDSMMVISINQETGDAKAVSLPRDLKTPTCTSTGKMNEVYWCNYLDYLNGLQNGKSYSNEQKQQYEKNAAEALAKKFEDVLGIKVQYRVHVNWQAVTQVIDAIGGIDVVFVYGDQKWDGDEVTIKTTDERGIADLSYDYVNYNFQYKNGVVVHLNGLQALAVARARNAFGGYGASGGNFSREYFQQRIIEAMVKKARKSDITSDLMKALKIKEAVGQNLRTNFKDTEIKTLLKLANSDILTKMETVSLYGDNGSGANLLTTGLIDGISYVYPAEGPGVYDQIHSYIKKVFSSADYVTEGAKIVVLNGTEVTGLAGHEKNDLEDDGYTVTQVANSPQEDGLANFDGVKVFQANSDKTKTAKALKKRYNVDIQTKIPDQLKDYEADFIIIIGNGYGN